jgi:uncharacterized FlgJ-related protein
MLKYIIISIGLLFPFIATAKITPQQYINTYKNGAIDEMKKYGIPASITLAQGLLESGNGNSTLATKANNHFGIKCHSSWKGKKVYRDDDRKNECFRKYKSALESYRDHSIFLSTQPRYASLFQLKLTDYKGWAKGLKKAGYATNPKYPGLLISLIERYDLQKYDTGKKHKPRKDKPRAPIASNNSSSVKRKVLRVGVVKYIIVKKGDGLNKIAKETDKDLWQLLKYNDIDKSAVLKIGQRIYLQPKKNKGKNKTYVVKTGDSMHSISQSQCIKLKKLYKRNNMKKSDKLKAGEKLYLRGYKPTDSY